MVEVNGTGYYWTYIEEHSGFKWWLKRQCTWRTFLSPILYLVFLCALFLYDRETVALIIKQSYGDVLLQFFVVLFILVLPIECLWILLKKIIRAVKNKKKEPDDSIWWSKICFVIVYSAFTIISYEFLEKDINQRKHGPQQTAVSLVSSLESGKGKDTSVYMKFKIDGELQRVEYDYVEWFTRLKVGSRIIVTYQIGCLNWIIFNKIELLDDTALPEDIGIDTWKIEHGKKLSPEEVDSLQKIKAGWVMFSRNECP